MSGAGAPAKRRGARAVLCAALALAGIGAVLVVAGRAPGRLDGADTIQGTPRVAALPASVASGGDTPAVAAHPARPEWQPPVAVTRARRDETAAPGPERGESPSLDGDDWRERVAAALGRKAVEGAPRDAGAVHTHLTTAEQPEARAPAVLLSAGPAGAEGLEGWDGGKFWFGPNGLVRMKEAQP